MSKHNELTEADLSGYTPNPRFLSMIEAYRSRHHLESDEMTILDWGCGRGQTVLYLRERGYRAYGVEIDSLPVDNGLPLFRSRGYGSDCLRLLSADGTTDFPDGFFHCVLSNNVLEHVSEMDRVTAETARITRKDGFGFHIYPAHRHPVEVHLYMPFVHWLPKNSLRRRMIAVNVRMGREPHWEQLDDASFDEKVDEYYRYSVDNTFYRRYPDVRGHFEDAGFQVRFCTIENPRLQQVGVVRRLQGNRLLRSSMDHLLLTYVGVELLATRA